DLELGLDHAVAGLQLELRRGSATARARDADLGAVAPANNTTPTAAAAATSAAAAGEGRGGAGEDERQQRGRDREGQKNRPVAGGRVQGGGRARGHWIRQGEACPLQAAMRLWSDAPGAAARECPPAGPSPPAG